ncbi:sodium-dependent phosphate transport protein 3-like isoform X4 [Aquila chrysaetos chrysaetos]|uniref:sodium-dependent phosphate transport protein 3-like isoform X4 n=1 Tax=Aquila chrysaetos chrysaetos TaxID=223781 RepID=UPI001B7D2BE0|nr:sodium-dependent phosphate transport protein 3-like isoform X4 [Aquila chrysaetos chrysaetos]
MPNAGTAQSWLPPATRPGRRSQETHDHAGPLWAGGDTSPHMARHYLEEKQAAAFAGRRGCSATWTTHRQGTGRKQSRTKPLCLLSSPPSAQGVIFPAQYTLWAKWAPPLERSRLMNIADAGCTFGTFFALLVAGIICQTLGWPFVSYIFGGVGCVWCLCWFLLVYEDPAHHPWISAREQEYIVSLLAHQGRSHGHALPLVAMAKSLPLWAITIACFCTDWLFYMLLTSMPTFMSNVLHFDLRENGLLSSLPYVGNGLGHILAGLLADFLLARQVLGTAAVRKLFSALGMLLPAIFLVAVPYIGCNSTVVVVLLTLALTIISMTGAGININHIDIAPRYAGFLLGITNTFGIVAGIIAPTAVGLLVSQDLQTGWRNAFFVSAALNLFGLIFYIAFGSGTIQDWAREDTAVQ